MFLHLGGNVVVHEKDIIAIFDLDKTTISSDTREFLKVAEEEGFVQVISDDIPKSFIITENNNKINIYLSPISSLTLKKRSENIYTALL